MFDGVKVEFYFQVAFSESSFLLVISVISANINVLSFVHTIYQIKLHLRTHSFTNAEFLIVLLQILLLILQIFYF